MKEKFILVLCLNCLEKMSFIESIHFKEIVRPLRTTFSTSLGQKDMMRSVIVSVILKDGSSGTGECPTSFSIKEETIPVIKGILREVKPELKGLSIDRYSEQIELFRKRYSRNPMTVSGLEVALLRAFLSSGCSGAQLFWGFIKTTRNGHYHPVHNRFRSPQKMDGIRFRKKVHHI